ncbi:MAG: metal ABC transporter permease [Deltaproteobacteria bacterium]|nr:metal ABC transporter permease [Deltaproteobacteria bacterium]
MTESISFWESWFVWRDAVIVSLIAAAALSYLGVWVVLKRVVYVPLALSQVSSVGVVTAFLVCDLCGHGEHGTGIVGVLLDPSWTSLLFAGLASAWFATARAHSSNATVVAYLLSAAAVLVMGGFIRQDLHDVQSLLFGHAVLVETIQIIYVGSAAFIVLVVHSLFYRRFLSVSYDPDSAGALGIRSLQHDILLYLTLGMMISIATRAIGALPAFGFAIFPALAGLRIGRSMRAAFLVAIMVGVLSAGLGYYLSFVWELPTGASMVGLAGGLYLLSAAISRLGRAK